MTYTQTGKVQAADYNTLISTINTVYGLGSGITGYGGFATGPGSVEPGLNTISELPMKLSGESITFRDWLDLRNAYQDCATHQGTILTVQQVGTNVPSYTLGQTIIINGITVTLTTSPAGAGEARDDINAAAIPNVTASLFGAAVKLTSTVLLTLAEGSGTALTDLGFIVGTYNILPNLNDMNDVNDIISFFTELLLNDQGGDWRRNDDDILANAQVHGGESYNITSGGGIASSSRSTSWYAQLEHQFSLTFGDQDETRAFFNTDGELRLSASRTGGSATLQNDAWDALLLAAGTFIFDQTNYFSLTTSYTTLMNFEDTTLGPYDIPNPIRWIIQAKTNTIVDPNARGGKGSIISFRSIFQDQHVGIGGGPDAVDGTFTSFVDEKRAIDIFVKPSPIYASIIDLTLGT